MVWGHFFPGLSPQGGHAPSLQSRCRGAAVCLAILLLATGASSAQEPAIAATATPSCGVREPGDARPRIGLALGGGGARGIAHISVLRKIEELRIPVDCIAGTSMGALVGGLYASGMSVDDMENWSCPPTGSVCSTTRWSDRSVRSGASRMIATAWLPSASASAGRHQAVARGCCRANASSHVRTRPRWARAPSTTSTTCRFRIAP